MSLNTVYFITGAARGLGKALTATYLSRPNNTVIAAVRNPSSASSLSELPVGENSKLIVVGLDSTDPSAPARAVSELEKQGITRLDTFIANAGISNDYSTIEDVPMDVLKSHIETNAYGPLLQFQALAPLLKKSDKPKFAAIGSALGSIAGMEKRPYPCAAYGISKVMLHYLVRKASFEGTSWGLTAFVLDPGFVQTDMGNKGAQIIGLEKAFTTIEDSLAFMVPVIDRATKEKTNGHFPSFEDGESVW